MPSKVELQDSTGNISETVSSQHSGNAKEPSTSTENSEMKLLMNDEHFMRNYKKQIRVGSKRRSNSLKDSPVKYQKTCPDLRDNFDDDSRSSDLFDSPNLYGGQLSVEDNISTNVKLKKNELNKDADYAMQNFLYQKSCKDSLLNNFVPIPSSNFIQPSIFEMNNATNGISNLKALHRSCNTTKKGPNSIEVPNNKIRNVSSDGTIKLVICNQPERRHRARYQTEGSRGAVKDRSGHSHPSIKLIGYNNSAKINILITEDNDFNIPHMFYQACKVTGKNSTLCNEENIDGTTVINIEADVKDDKPILIDCVGILKERNVDVEQRFPNKNLNRQKKKSTCCRMTFRTTIINKNNNPETLQISSEYITCTQPPGVPEISKRSLTSSHCNGGNEMFLIGKNFSKECKVIFQEIIDDKIKWKKVVIPDKEHVNQTHLVFTVPPYWKLDIQESIEVQFFVESPVRTSDPQSFTYTPITMSGSIENDASCKNMILPKMLWNTKNDLVPNTVPSNDTIMTLSSVPCSLPRTTSNSNLGRICRNVDHSTNNVDILTEKNTNTTTNCLDNNNHRINETNNMMLNPELQTENKSNAATLDEYMQNSVVKTELIKLNDDMESSLASMQAPPYDILQQFVVTESSNVPLPVHSGAGMENFLSHLDSSNNDLSTIIMSKNLNAVMNNVNSTVDSNSFFPQPGSQSFFPIIDDSQLKSRNLNENNNDVLQTATDTILFSNISPNSSSNRNLFTNPVSSNIMLIETLNNNTMVTSTPLIDTSHGSNNNTILINTQPTETSTNHNELILANASEMNTGSKNMQAILSGILQSGQSMSETQTSHNTAQQQFVSYTTSPILDLVNNNTINPNSLVTVQNVKKEPELMLNNSLNHMSNNGFINFI